MPDFMLDVGASGAVSRHSSSLQVCNTLPLPALATLELQ